MRRWAAERGCQQNRDELAQKNVVSEGGSKKHRPEHGSSAAVVLGLLAAASFFSVSLSLCLPDFSSCARAASPAGRPLALFGASCRLPWAQSPAWQTPSFFPLRPQHTALTQSYLYRREAGRHEKITLWLNGKVQGAMKPARQRSGRFRYLGKTRNFHQAQFWLGVGWQPTGFAETFPTY